MWQRRTVLSAGAALIVSACGGGKFPKYTGPEVTRVVVQKGQRRMYLLNGSEVLRAYKVDLGFAPVGHKNVEGDGKTPEGTYNINRRNPNSSFYLSIGISYPNEADVARAKALGQKPGGDIFIHGARRPLDRKGADWTWGCVSVKNSEMKEIYSMVNDGTQIDLNP